VLLLQNAVGKIPHTLCAVLGPRHEALTVWVEHEEVQTLTQRSLVWLRSAFRRVVMATASIFMASRVALARLRMVVAVVAPAAASLHSLRSVATTFRCVVGTTTLEAMATRVALARRALNVMTEAHAFARAVSRYCANVIPHRLVGVVNWRLGGRRKVPRRADLEQRRFHGACFFRCRCIATIFSSEALAFFDAIRHEQSAQKRK
jgi:hypothetical protein